MHMSQTVTPLNAMIFGGGGGTLTGSEVKWFFLVAAVGLLVSICWQLIDDWYKRVHGRNWPTVQAVIDIVSVTVVESKLPSSMAVHNWPSYLATLTYSFRNPDQQTGDYKRSFGNDKDAKDWADSYKGETVKVHVDPRDPTRSVLREEDLWAIGLRGGCWPRRQGIEASPRQPLGHVPQCAGGAMDVSPAL